MIRLDLPIKEVSVTLEPATFEEIDAYDAVFEKEMDVLEDHLCHYQSKHIIPKDPNYKYSPNPKAKFFKILSKNGMVGFLEIMPGMRNHTMWLSSFYIVPTERSRGYGRAALEELKQVVKSMGCDKLFLRVLSNNKAIKMYEQVGFKTEVTKVLLANI